MESMQGHELMPQTAEQQILSGAIQPLLTDIEASIQNPESVKAGQLEAVGVRVGLTKAFVWASTELGGLNEFMNDLKSGVPDKDAIEQLENAYQHVAGFLGSYSKEMEQAIGSDGEDSQQVRIDILKSLQGFVEASKTNEATRPTLAKQFNNKDSTEGKLQWMRQQATRSQDQAREELWEIAYVCREGVSFIQNGKATTAEVLADLKSEWQYRHDLTADEIRTAINWLNK